MIQTASLVPVSAEPASEQNLNDLTAVDIITMFIKEHRDSSNKKPKIKIINRPSRPAADHPGGIAEQSRPESSSRPPNRPPPPSPTQIALEKIATSNDGVKEKVGISNHRLRELRDGTLVRGELGATFGGFIPSRMAAPRHIPPSMRYLYNEPDAEHEDFEDEDFEDDDLEDEDFDVREFDVEDFDDEDFDDEDIEDAIFKDVSFRLSPTPPDAVYFVYPEDGDVQDLTDAGCIYVNPRAIERAHSTSNVETPRPPTTEPRTNIMATSAVIDAEDF
ncbi:hypothetical protein F4801DRAFT_552870 [Xylaria longipes]|nr:hypothetical protein F4801DRAFT_552870 [Xylaria longipes]